MMGFIYLKGQGVKQDYQQAMFWYLRAAEQGYPIAQHNLGVMYAKGQGVAQDYKQAVSWYRKAAEQGHAPAQAILGFMYLKGRGSPGRQAGGIVDQRPPNGSPTRSSACRTLRQRPGSHKK
jgi:TPR repeat protein